MAETYDISIIQGSSFSLQVTARDASGTLMNLSGYAARGGIKTSYGATGYLLTLSPVIDPSLVSGIVNLNISASATAALPVTKAVYDIEVYQPTGDTFKILRGYAEISPEVST